MICRGLRHSAVVVIVIVRNRSCDTTAAATVQHCRSSSSQRLRHTAVAAAAPAMISRRLRRSTVVVIVIVRNRSCDTTTAATVQRLSSSQVLAPSLALAGTRGTAAQQQPGPRSFSSFGWDQRYNGGHSTASQQQPGPRPFSSFSWEQRYACHNRPPVNAGLANNIAQGQAQRDVDVDDRAEQQLPSTEVDYHGGPLPDVFGPPESVEHQRATTEMDCHGGPISEVSGPPEATSSLARGGLPSQARHQRRLHPPSGTLSLPTAVISDSIFEE